jgi:hypothetical protein
VDPAALVLASPPAAAPSRGADHLADAQRHAAHGHDVAISESGTAHMTAEPTADGAQPQQHAAAPGGAAAGAGLLHITTPAEPPAPAAAASAGAGSATPGFPAALHPAAGGARRLSVNGAVSAALHAAVPVLLPRVRKLLRATPDGVARLVAALDARRGEGTVLTRPSFDALSSVLLTALDVADQRNDFPRARALMVISQTFFCYVHADDDTDALDAAVVAAARDVDGSPRRAGAAAAGGAATPDRSSRGAVLLSSPETGSKAGTTRLYLQSRIKQHRIWQNVQYWEGAVFDTIGAEMSKIKTDSRCVAVLISLAGIRRLVHVCARVGMRVCWCACVVAGGVLSPLTSALAFRTHPPLLASSIQPRAT